MAKHETCTHDAMDTKNVVNPRKRTPTAKRLDRNNKALMTPMESRILRKKVEAESGKHADLMEGGTEDRRLFRWPSRAEVVMWRLLIGVEDDAIL